jgi:O-antigen/teichoic acid export membrane protein
MKPNGGSNEWFRGAFILTIGALLTKILSAGYRVPFQNIVGDIGFYIYQQVYPFYGLALVLSTYGFPVIISKHFSDLKEKNQVEKAYRFLALSFIVLSVFGIIAFLSLYYGSSWIAYQMNDSDLALLFKVISVVFLVFPIISVLRGYFQGMGNMVPTASSQVGEQLVRVATILTIAILFTKEGMSLYMVGSGAAFGSITGGIMAIAILIFFFLKGMKSKNDWLRVWDKSLFIELGKVSKFLFLQGFAVCISGMVFIFIQLADALNMLPLLVSIGIETESAKALKGVYDRGQPLIQLGTIVATSMSLSLVPIISSVRMKENRRELYEKIHFALNISLIIGAAATVGLLAIIQQTNVMLYENGAGSSILAALTPIILLSSLLLTLIAILQGLGVMFYPAIVILVISALKYLLNLFLIYRLGPIGAAIATNISIGIGVLLLWWKLSRLINKPLLSLSFSLKLGWAALVMFLVLKTYIFVTEPVFQIIESNRLVATFQSLSAVGIGGVLYLIVIMRSHLLRFEDLALLPFGSKLVFLLPKPRRIKEHAKKN